jgi:hypothetical protein
VERLIVPGLQLRKVTTTAATAALHLHGLTGFECVEQRTGRAPVLTTVFGSGDAGLRPMGLHRWIRAHALRFKLKQGRVDAWSNAGTTAAFDNLSDQRPSGTIIRIRGEKARLLC